MRISDWSSDVCSSDLMGNFIVSGLFDKYPRMKMVSVESGIGWIPFMLEALEYQVDEMMPDKKLARRPTEYFRDQMYASFWFEKRSEEHTSELQSLMRISYAVFCLKKKNEQKKKNE